MFVNVIFRCVGAVLIFLPGYDEIVTLRDKILYEDKHFADSSKSVVDILFVFFRHQFKLIVS